VVGCVRRGGSIMFYVLFKRLQQTIYALKSKMYDTNIYTCQTCECVESRVNSSCRI